MRSRHWCVCVCVWDALVAQGCLVLGQQSSLVINYLTYVTYVHTTIKFQKVRLKITWQKIASTLGVTSKHLKVVTYTNSFIFFGWMPCILRADQWCLAGRSFFCSAKKKMGVPRRILWLNSRCAPVGI